MVKQHKRLIEQKMRLVHEIFDLAERRRWSDLKLAKNLGYSNAKIITYWRDGRPPAAPVDRLQGARDAMKHGGALRSVSTASNRSTILKPIDDDPVEESPAAPEPAPEPAPAPEPTKVPPDLIAAIELFLESLPAELLLPVLLKRFQA